jgi:fructokinase
MKSPQQIAIFGEALIDQFPDGHQILGGAPFNVAWHLQAFGQSPSFISRVGRDAVGDSIRQAMVDWGMNVENVQTDADYPSGTVKVTIHQGEPRYDILADQAYDYIDARQLNPGAVYSVLYHGTLALRNATSAQALHELTARLTGNIFVDVNLRAPWWRKDSVNQWLSKADWVKLNQDELMQLAPPHHTMSDAMRSLQALHDLDVLIVTCGSLGARALNRAGEFFEIAPAGQMSVVDTVGAGDAFSAVLLLGMRQGWPLALTMERAQAFASALVGRRGATVQDLGFYQTFIRAWDLQR